LRCERDDARPILGYDGAAFYQHRLVVVGYNGGESAVDFCRLAYRSSGDPHTERAGQGLHGGCARSAPREACIGQKRNPRCRRDQFVQQLEALAVELSTEVHYPGDIAARVRQAAGETSLDEIPPGNHDDW
jgi:hypothetical protein